MKQRVQGIIIGIIITSVFMFSFSGFAESFTKTVSVTFNSINIKVNNITLKPTNIVYNGTTYVPLRAIAEMLNKDVKWDSTSKTAIINDKPDSNLPTPTPTAKKSDDLVYFKDYKNVFIKLDSNLYSGDIYIDSLYKKGDRYYCSLRSIKFILNLIAERYKTKKSSNPYLAGNIVLDNMKYEDDAHYEYTDINTKYYVGSIYDKDDKNKAYKFSLKSGEEKGVIIISGRTIACIDDVLECFGYTGKYKVEFDDINKNIIIVVNK